MGQFWGHFELFWGHFAPILGHFGAILASFCPPGGARGVGAPAAAPGGGKSAPGGAETLPGEPRIPQNPKFTQNSETPGGDSGKFGNLGQIRGILGGILSKFGNFLEGINFS